MAPLDLSALKRLRGAVKSATTRAVTDINQFLATASITAIIGKKNAVERNLKKICQYDEQIAQIIDTADLEKEVDESLNYMTGIEVSLAVLNDRIQCLQTSQSTTSIKLPTVQLPVFSGEVTEWTQFWDLFESAIHRKTDISAIQKLTYLKGQLSGQAETLVGGLKIEAANYEKCVDLLKNTYGRESVIKASHVQNLVNLPIPECSFTELNDFRASFECHLRSLEILQLTLEELFSILLMNKLPQQFKEVIKRAAGDDWLDLNKFRQVYQTELENLQTSGPNILDVENSLATASFGVRHEGKDTSKQSPGMFCKLCKGSHIWFRCMKYGDATSRIAQIRKLNLCLVCLANNHFVKDCNVKLRPCLFCKGNHFHHLCVKSKSRSKPSITEVKSTHAITHAQSRGSGEVSVENNKSSWANMTCVLSTVNIPLLGKGNKHVNCRAFLDQGSQVSFIHRDLLSRVRHEFLGRETLKLRTYHCIEEEKDYRIVKVFFQHRGKQVSIECFVDDTLPGPHDYKGLNRHVTRLQNQGIRLADDYLDSGKTFDLLIGLDNYYNLVHPGYRRQGDLVLLPTKFGYALSGKFPRKTKIKQTHTVSVLKVATSQFDSFDNSASSVKSDLSALWELDNLGIKPVESDSESCKALEHFNENVEFSEVEQQYMVRLPWKNSTDCLPTNFNLALGRLKGLQKKFLLDPVFCQNYSKVIQEQEERGFIQRVHPSEHEKPCHYLAHHGVLKNSLTTPVRTVFDCSARLDANTPSLNDLLYTGPSLVTHLCQVLLRLRLHSYAAVGDIEKAFLMIKLHPKDRDFTRFLWFENPSDINSKLITYRFTVVLFGATCSQFLLNATILHHLSALEGCDYLHKGLYIDNLILTSNTQEQLLTRYWTAQQVFSSAHLFLREWVTNSSCLLEQITLDGTKANDQSVIKVMGMRWWPNMDGLGFQPSFQDVVLQDIVEPTKRILLSTVARVFDPLGLLLPVTIRSRILLQEIWRRQIDWNDKIPEDLFEVWKTLFQDLQDSLSIIVPRQIGNDSGKNVLHVFADASALAFGCALYVVSKGDSRLVMAKARVAPIKGLTIPKMELTAVLMAARLLKFVREAFSPDMSSDHCVVWSDSQIVLHWLHTNNSTLPVYVRNRVDEIKYLIPTVEFRYIPTQDNPADLLTRGQSAVVLSDSQLWWKGPSWLPSKCLWPQWSVAVEGFGTPVGSNVCVVDACNQLAMVAVNPQPVELLDWLRYSTFERLLRVVAWIFRFVYNLQRTIKGDHIRAEPYINLTELKMAERRVVCLAQLESFTHEVKYLRDGIGNEPNLVKQLNLFYNDETELLHCRRRLLFADLEDNVKYPILLPRCHRVTHLIIERAHRHGMHYGVNHVMTVLRQYWWIPRMRQTVKSVVGKCLVCRRWKSKAFPTIAPPDLPSYRVNCVEPFAVTGVDYTGAVTIRAKVGTHSMSKVYIVLFTCAVTRAIHIEIAEDLSCDTFLKVFRRFCGRRSFPTLMLSDNATYFTAAAKFLHNIMSQEDVVNYLSRSGCEWKFIPQRAPWFGAIWERCIGIVKAGVNKVLGRALVTYDELHTVLVELEATINDRPLTYPSGDLQDPEALTPSHLLNGRRLRPYPLLAKADDVNDPEFVMSQASSNALRERYQHVSKVSNDLWRRWIKEYLTMIRMNRPSNATIPHSWPSVGEVVMLGDDKSRLDWKLGLVTKLYRGNDNSVRVVQLKTAFGQTIRPVVKLYPLELHSEDLVDRPDQSVDQTENPQGTVVNRTPRLSARGAQQMWRDRIQAGQL